MPRLDGSHLPTQPDYPAERQAEADAQEADLRAYLLTPAGQAALLAGTLAEFVDDEGMENDGD